MDLGRNWRSLLKIITFVLVMTALWPGPTEAAPNYNQSPLNTESKYKLVATYTGLKGITINSYSSQWEQEEKLKGLYDELLANFHGVELGYLSTVNIFPDYVYGKGVAGLYHGSYYNIAGSEERGYNKGRIIDLAAGDQNSTIDLMAKTLAHEYGHHFTMYYLWLKEGKTFDQWKETQWAKVRGLTNIPAVGNGEHIWAPEEIAADDYVQLFGSALARISADFQSQYGNFDNSVYNLAPQENLELPLAAQVPRLEEYWLGLMGVLQTTKINQAPLAPTLALTGVEERSQRFVNLVFRWTKSIDDSSGPLEYTLITYRKGDTLATPILTQSDGYQATYIYRGETGTRLFRLLVKDVGGKLSSSNVLEVNLGSPVLGQLPEEEDFRDVPRSYWAFPQIKELAQKDYISGFPDATFRPEQAVTRAEFATLLVRVMGWEEGEDNSANTLTDVQNHWAAGFVAKAREKGIVGGYDNNTFRPENEVTRGEMATMLARVLESESLASGQAKVDFQELSNPGVPAKSGLVDIDKHWARAYISAVEDVGLVTGFPNGKFAPDDSVKRGELAVVFTRLLALIGK